MKEQFLEREIKNTEAKYLKEGVAPIMACVGTPEDLDFNGLLRREDVYDVDYYGDSEELINKGFKNSGDRSYVISAIDKDDKFSKNFYDCTGIVIVVQDKETGENVSFLSHQDPQYFLLTEEKKKNFLNDLRERIEEIKNKCVEKTIDSRIIGGNYFSSKNYIESIKLLSSEILKKLGFEPAVVTGPKITGGSDFVYFDNKNRRLYLLRPEVGNATTISYEPKDIDSQKEKWE